MGSVVAPLFNSKLILLLSPFCTLDTHVTLIVPDCLDSQVYNVTLTSSAAVGLTLTVTFAVLDMVELDFKLTFSWKLSDVSVVTEGAMKEAVGCAAF